MKRVTLLALVGAGVSLVVAASRRGRRRGAVEGTAVPVIHSKEEQHLDELGQLFAPSQLE